MTEHHVPATLSANFAITADGKINRSLGQSSIFTSKLDLQQLIELRKGKDALLVGRTTLECDAMSMTIPDTPLEQQPARIIVSHSGKIDFNHKVFQTPGGDLHIISSKPRPENAPDLLQWHQMTLQDFLKEAHLHGIQTIHCEGGSALFYDLIKQNAISELNLTLNPSILFGGQDCLSLIGLNTLQKSVRFNLVEHHLNDASELFLKYRCYSGY